MRYVDAYASRRTHDGELFVYPGRRGGVPRGMLRPVRHFPNSFVQAGDYQIRHGGTVI